MILPPSRRLDFDEVPVIDLAPLMTGADESARAETIAAVGQACRDVGFLYIKNHDLAEPVIDTLREEAEAYFARPTAEKEALILDQRLRGYLPLDYDSYTGEPGAAKSRQEGFWIGFDRSLNSENLMDGPNRWPEHGDALKAAMEGYRDGAERIARALQSAFAQALGWEEERLHALFTPAQSFLKLNHYPPQDAPTSLSHIGVVPHSDSGGFTILWQDEHGGLEVQTKSGEWVGAPPIPGTLVVNIGSVLQIWSDGAFSATPHRVINRAGADRYSIPYFVNPRADAPIGSLVGEGDGDASAACQTYADYQRASWRRTFPIAGI